jgi:hypothetical protein
MRSDKPCTTQRFKAPLVAEVDLMVLAVESNTYDADSIQTPGLVASSSIRRGPHLVALGIKCIFAGGGRFCAVDLQCLGLRRCLHNPEMFQDIPG